MGLRRRVKGAPPWEGVLLPAPNLPEVFSSQRAVEKLCHLPVQPDPVGRAHDAEALILEHFQFVGDVVLGQPLDDESKGAAEAAENYTVIMGSEWRIAMDWTSSRK